MITDNALCVAADERAEVYARDDVTDADLARADMEFLDAVDRIAGGQRDEWQDRAREENRHMVEQVEARCAAEAEVARLQTLINQGAAGSMCPDLRTHVERVRRIVASAEMSDPAEPQGSTMAEALNHWLACKADVAHIGQEDRWALTDADVREVSEYLDRWFADHILTSDRLAQRDRDVAAQALRGVADRMPVFHDRDAPEWAWAVMFVRKWLRNRADHIERGE